MADAFPVDVAQIVALFLESIFYGEYLSCFVVILYVTEPSRTPGIYLVSFGMCMYLMLVKAPSRQGRRNVFLVVALLLFVFATLDVVLLLVHVLHAFIWYHGPGGAIGEFSDISYWVNAMKIVDYNAQTSIANGMLVSKHPASILRNNNI